MKKSGKIQTFVKTVLILLTLSHTVKSWDSSSNHIESCPTGHDHQHYTGIKHCKITLERGEDGLPGPQGNQGPRGHTGKDGEKGDAGKVGNKGPLGDMGPMGPVGLPGVDGQNIKGPDGPKGDDGQDAHEIICLCQDDIYAYFCCLLDNKDNTDSCDDAREAVKTCEDKCDAADDKEEKVCETQETECKAKCETAAADGGDINLCQHTGIYTNPDELKAACEASCEEIKKTCLSIRGCIQEQEQKCMNKCPEGDISKFSSCEMNCLFIKNETDYQETCDCLFPIKNPYEVYTIKDENNGFLRGRGPQIDGAGAGSAADDDEYNTWFDQTSPAFGKWLFLKSDKGYVIINCNNVENGGSFALNASELTDGNINLGGDGDESFCINKDEDDDCFYLSYYDAGTTTQNGYYLNVGPEDYSVGDEVPGATLSSTAKTCFEIEIGEPFVPA